MQRFNLWHQSLMGDYWKDRFKPRELIRTTAHLNSILSGWLDYQLLERYDISDISESTVGKTYSWVPIELDPPFNVDTSGTVYKYQYKVDSNWLYIDAIYNSHTEPDLVLQNEIDFKYIEGSGVLATVKEIPEEYLANLYISKGQYSEYRLYNELGCLLDYKRKDSTRYRDSFDPILGSFFLGPTYHNLTAVLNQVIGYPVVKYGNETVLSTKDNIVITDKYQYDMRGANISVKAGDVLQRWDPLSKDIELITHKTHPYWWKDMSVGLFTKYHEDVTQSCNCEPSTGMTEELRDYLMENFLYDVVLYIRFSMDIPSLKGLGANSDILKLFFDALPVRSDIVMSQDAHFESLDESGEILDPEDYAAVRLGINDFFFLGNIPDGEYPNNLTPKDIGRPIILDPNSSAEYIDPSLVFTKGVWHIFNEHGAHGNNEFWQSKNKENEFLRTSKDGVPTLEPFYDNIYIRTAKDTLFTDRGLVGIHVTQVTDIDNFTVASYADKDSEYIVGSGLDVAQASIYKSSVSYSSVGLHYGGNVGDSGQLSLMPESEAFTLGSVPVSNSLGDIETYLGITGKQEIPGEYYCGNLVLQGWDTTDNTIYTPAGIQVATSNPCTCTSIHPDPNCKCCNGNDNDIATGSVISNPGLYLGLIPKTITVTGTVRVPDGLSASVYYSINNTNDWILLPNIVQGEEPDIIENVSGRLYIKAVLQADRRNSATFSNLTVSIDLHS